MVRSALTVQEKAEIWRAYRAGASLRSISRTLGRTMEALRTLVAATGGRPPVAATSVRSASIVRPSVRLIDRSDAPARYARQISAFSCTVNADRTITTTSVAHEQASPVRQG